MFAVRWFLPPLALSFIAHDHLSWLASLTHEAHTNCSCFASCINSNDNEPHSDGFVHAIIIQIHIAWRNYLQVSNAILCEVMCFVASESMIHLQTLLKCAPCCVVNANLSSSFTLLPFSFFLFFVL